MVKCLPGTHGVLSSDLSTAQTRCAVVLVILALGRVRRVRRGAVSLMGQYIAPKKIKVNTK